MPIDINQLKQLGQRATAPVQNAASGLKPYLLPAALGAGIGGPLMAYFAGRNHVEGESPKARRHRILRNAVLGLTLGGAAGAGIPAGAKTISDQFNPVSRMGGFHPVDATANFGMRHILPTLTGVAGGLTMAHRLGVNREQAAERIADTMEPHENMGRAGSKNLMTAKIMANAGNPDTQHETLVGLSRVLGGKSPGAIWRAREMFGEAGHSFPSVSDIFEQDPEKGVQMMSALKSHLGSDPYGRPVSWAMSHLVPSTDNEISRQTGQLFSPYRAAELYSKYIRPSIGSNLKSEGFRLGAAPMAVGVGGAVLGANYLQNKILGN